jgi:glycosyltransferase involved in cell wall biosynthesis
VKYRKKNMRILAIGDTADNSLSLKKFVKNSQIHLITFPRKQAELFTLSDDVERFDSLLISKQVKKINKIKNQYDLCLVLTWSAARIAYLSDLNYIMYFVGGDITEPPFEKMPKAPYLENPIHNRNFLERYFYKRIFDNAIACIAGTEEYFEKLKKFRKDAIRLDNVFVDTTIFNDKIKPIDLKTKKFTFLSAQKFGLEKGFDIIFEALKFCKSEFDILQVEWFTQRTEEEENKIKELLAKKPPQMKFIPLIKRSELGRYFKSVDAILGQMRAGMLGGIERDASFCKVPILCYIDQSKPMIINEEKVIPPFLPKTKNPKELAKLIDRIVESKEFRDKLAIEEFNYSKRLNHPEIAARAWENLFIKINKKYPLINKNSSKIKKMIENIIIEYVEKLIYKKKMRDKNIQGWGKEEYYKLIK